MRHKSELEAWCDAHGWRMVIHNEGHHWQFRSRSQQVDWWPSSAKLVINEKWNDQHLCGDVPSVIEKLAPLSGESEEFAQDFGGAMDRLRQLVEREKARKR